MPSLCVEIDPPLSLRQLKFFNGSLSSRKLKYLQNSFVKSRNIFIMLFKKAKYSSLDLRRKIEVLLLNLLIKIKIIGEISF